MSRSALLLGLIASLCSAVSAQPAKSTPTPDKAPVTTSKATASGTKTTKTPTPPPPRTTSSTPRKASKPKSKPKGKPKGKPFGKAKCVLFYKDRSFLEAAFCFEKLGKQMGPGAQLSTLRAYEKGQLLRNAAVAFHRAAKNSKLPEVAAYLRERAVKLLRLYQEEKLCESNYRCRIALDMETRIRKGIGYARLAVVTNSPNSLTQVFGYKQKYSSQGNMNLEVRPGRFRVIVSYRKGPKQVRILLVQPGSNVIETFSPPQKKNAISTTSIGLYIASALAVLGSGTLISVGAVNWVGAENKWLDPTTPQSEGKALREQRDIAQPMMWAGAGGVAVGVALLVMGIAFHRVSSPPPPALVPKKANASWLVQPPPLPLYQGGTTLP